MRVEDRFDVFHLSRIGAHVEYEGYEFHSDIAYPAGSGIHIEARCDGENLRFWTSDSEWCAWVAQQLPVGSLGDLEDDMKAVLASWTLSPVHDFLRANGAAGCGPARVEPAMAPDGSFWRVTLVRGDYRLALYLVDVPDDWRWALLSALSPNPDREISLTLGLGWCLLNEAIWDQVSTGDALTIYGAADTLDVFWLHPAATPGRLRLHGCDAATALEGATDFPCTQGEDLRLIVEVGRVRIKSIHLDQWRADQDIALQVVPYPVVQLSANDRIYAFGELLRFENGWAIRVCNRCNEGHAATVGPSPNYLGKFVALESKISLAKHTQTLSADHHAEQYDLSPSAAD